MIDLHAHILPGIDDGAKSWEDTLEMARLSLDDGVTCIVATPHMMPDGEYCNRATDVLPKVEEAKARLAEERIPLELVAGGELYLSPHVEAGVNSGELLTYGNQKRYVLVELPGFEVPPFCERVLFQLQVKGVRPILAHPERNVGLRQEFERLAEWVKRGLLLQVNARSLLGESGSRAQRFAEELLEWRMVHFLASDAHGVRRRPPGLAKAKEHAARIAGRDVADALVHSNPGRVLAGEHVEAWSVERPARRGVLSRLFRRA